MASIFKISRTDWIRRFSDASKANSNFGSNKMINVPYVYNNMKTSPQLPTAATKDKGRTDWIRQPSHLSVAKLDHSFRNGMRVSQLSMTMMSTLQIHPTNTKISNIRPSRQRDSSPEYGVIYPTVVDMMSADLYVPMIFAYRLEKNSDQEHLRFITRLKDSLERVLVPFYGFAGRWFPHETYGRQLICNDEGVPFVEAALLEEKVDCVIPESGGLRAVVGLNGYEAVQMDQSKRKQTMLPEGLPCIFVQVTRFRCGGVVLGVTFNHTLCDGKSFIDFIVSWAELGRTNTMTFQPDFNRWLTRAPLQHLETLVAGLQNAKKEGFHERGLEIPTSNTDPPVKRSETQTINRIYEVNLSSINAMKKAVSEKGDRGQYVSTTDCITAHVWKCLFQLSPSTLEKSGFSIWTTVEGRMRFYDHPLPNVVGNVLSMYPCPSLPTGEITGKATHELAQILRANLLGTKQEQWFSEKRVAQFAQASMSGRQFILTSWISFPIYDIDFGVGGRPYFGGRPYYSPGVNMLNSPIFGTCVVAPAVRSRASSSAATILWALPREVLVELESSTDFLELFLK